MNWGAASGSLSVTETRSNGCVYGPVELFVTADAATAVENRDDVNDKIFIGNKNGVVEYVVKSRADNKFSVFIHDITGKIIYKENNRHTNRLYVTNQKLFPGMYVMNCITSNGKLVKMFVLD